MVSATENANQNLTLDNKLIPNSQSTNNQQIPVEITKENTNTSNLKSTNNNQILKESQFNINIHDGHFLSQNNTVIEISTNQEINTTILMFINNKNVANHTINEYNPFTKFTLNDLNITKTGTYNITAKYLDETGTACEINKTVFNYVEFNNDTYRAITNDDNRVFKLFCPENALGNITILISNKNNTSVLNNFTFKINNTYRGKWFNWTYKKLNAKDQVNFKITLKNTTGVYEIPIEQEYSKKTSFNISFINNSATLFEILIPENYNNNSTVTLTNNNYNYIINLNQHKCKWNNGTYKYIITLDDLDFFNRFNDKDMITSVFINNGIIYDTGFYALQKENGNIKLYSYDENLVFYKTVNNGGYENQSQINNDSEIIIINIPDKLNLLKGEITIISSDKIIFSKKLSQLNKTYNYTCLGDTYKILYKDLNNPNLQDKDLLNISLISKEGEIIFSNRNLINSITIEGNCFYEVSDDFIEKSNGAVLNITGGNLKNQNNILELIIADKYNNASLIIYSDDNILLNKSLNELNQYKMEYLYDYGGYRYVLPKNIIDLNNVSNESKLRFSIISNSEEINYAEAVVVKKESGNFIIKIYTVKDILDNIHVKIINDLLINVNDNLVNFNSIVDRRNLESETGGGYFTVYVDNVKVEGLGKLLSVDDKEDINDLILYYLINNPDFNLTLNNLGIDENGAYNIRITHSPDFESQISENDDLNYYSLENKFYYNTNELELINMNITLTSNIKINYCNNTTILLTDYGLNPELLYLNTYYNDINKTTGTITILNNNNERILYKNISSLKYNNHCYSIYYSDFENNNFTDNITVLYNNGNERDSKTILKVLWRQLEKNDFNPRVNDAVNNYYDNIINLTMPDSVDNGQIIVNVKFKGNYTSNLSNINVTSEFENEMIYKFKVSEIKLNYPEDFILSLSNLGLYENTGNYIIDVKFTADDINVLDVINNISNVKFLKDILIKYNKTLRYAYSSSFASVEVFEPVNAYVDLYIDGELYSHKTSFKNGVINFSPSHNWNPGNHTAEIIVVDAESGVVLNSSNISFEILTQTGDVDVSVNSSVKENQNITLRISVPQDGEVLIRVDNINHSYNITSGYNIIDLGVLSYGRHILWVLYENDNCTSFYNNYLPVYVGDDGHWFNISNPVILNYDDIIHVNLGENNNGHVIITIDNVEIANLTLIKGNASLNLSDYIKGNNRFGIHTYNITYYPSDETEILSKTGKFNVTYIFMDDIDNDYPLKESYTVTVMLPDDATGRVTMTIVDENSTTIKYVQDVIKGKVIFDLFDLGIGKYYVDISYSGDNNYPKSSYSKVLKVNNYAVLGQITKNNKQFTLILPANATGNLTIYNYEKEKLASAKLINGKADIQLNNLYWGIYDVIACYEGDDYHVKPFTAIFKVIPEIYISQNIILGDNVTIYMDLGNATGDIAISIDNMEPKVFKINNGIVNYTFSSDKYSLGNHTVNFMYFGTSFNGYIFYEYDEKTKVDYYLQISPKKTITNGKSTKKEVIIYVRDLDHVIMKDAMGSVKFFIEDEEYNTVDVVNGTASLNISNLTDGDYKVSWIYSGDNQYASSSYSMIINVVQGNAKITASSFKVYYTSPNYYIAVIYNEKGNLAIGEDVTFLINNQVYKKVKTNYVGVARITITSPPGSYRITTKALDATTTQALHVLHIISLKKAKIKKTAKKVIIKASLKKINGNYLRGKTITFKFKNKIYHAKTNHVGVAKITIKSKVLKKLKAGKKITYQATYMRDSAFKTVKVKK